MQPAENGVDVPPVSAPFRRRIRGIVRNVVENNPENIRGNFRFPKFQRLHGGIVFQNQPVNADPREFSGQARAFPHKRPIIKTGCFAHPDEQDVFCPPDFLEKSSDAAAVFGFDFRQAFAGRHTGREIMGKKQACPGIFVKVMRFVRGFGIGVNGRFKTADIQKALEISDDQINNAVNRRPSDPVKRVEAF
jgi:hypothetical protein